MECFMPLLKKQVSGSFIGRIFYKSITQNHFLHVFNKAHIGKHACVCSEITRSKAQPAHLQPVKLILLVPLSTSRRRPLSSPSLTLPWLSSHSPLTHASIFPHFLFTFLPFLPHYPHTFPSHTSPHLSLFPHKYSPHALPSLLPPRCRDTTRYVVCKIQVFSAKFSFAI